MVRFGGADFVAAVGSRREDGGEEEEQCAVCRMGECWLALCPRCMGCSTWG